MVMNWAMEIGLSLRKKVIIEGYSLGIFLEERRREGKESRNVSRTFDEIILDLKAQRGS
jgi:hypothetical protein